MEQVLARLPRVAMALVQVLEAVTEAVPSVVPAVCNHLADFIVSSAQADHEVDPEALSAARSEFVYCLPLIQYLVGNLAVQAAVSLTNSSSLSYCFSYFCFAAALIFSASLCSGERRLRARRVVGRHTAA